MRKDDEKMFEEYWRGIVAPEGIVSMAVVKRELADYKRLMDAFGIDRERGSRGWARIAAKKGRRCPAKA